MAPLHSQSEAGFEPIALLEAETSAASSTSHVPPTVGIVMGVRSRHSGHIFFSFPVSVSLDGEKFMLELKGFLAGTVSTNPHVAGRGSLHKVFYRDTIEFATVSSLRARDIEEGLVWPVEAALSDTTCNPELTAGYRRPSILRRLTRFPEHPAFFGPSHDRLILVIGREINLLGVVGAICSAVVTAVVAFVLVGALAKRWDIAAGVGCFVLAAIAVLQGLAFYLISHSKL
ncbi:hypothetical protein GQ53DRAFT_814632 [Thozetella sp. PMI_491]|nr:hypothetical protein GQ53DRAFT_814632 [Thozetella sp. PMI_491]